MSAREFAARLTAAGDARLDGRITREDHAVIVAGIGSEMETAGITWGQVAK